jgi:phosphoglycolate phosphatase-like HAD superfamily hydrolase
MISTIENAEVVFWDFDGVIKDSVEVKSNAFEQLFLPFGEKVSTRVRKHHEDNGGMSRYDKLPSYLSWAGQEVTARLTAEYAENFSQIVKQKVINSEWILGVLGYLINNFDHQQYFLVTATPQQEIEDILAALKINNYFKEVLGYPTKKCEAIRWIIERYNIKLEQAIMIGDSNSDYRAAEENKLPFILRRTNLNKRLQQQLNCKMIENFL